MKRATTPFVLVSIGVVLLIAPALRRTLARTELRSPNQDRILTFAERVAYQYAIEEVYWRHRIWPKENVRLKPSLDEVMPRHQIEKTVEDYLRNSQLLADQWQRPITTEQLQTEMERIANHTRQPDVLRELFASLDNDPFVIAECLARAILAERLVADLTSCVGRRDGSPSRPSSASQDVARPAVAPYQTDGATYNLPEVSVPADCATDAWTATSITNAPSPRYRHTTVWTGSEMIVWGGENFTSYLNSGGRYNPITDTWIATSITNVPAARYGHTAVWTGNEMIVWGGSDGSLGNTGGRYNPATNSWMSTSITNAPTGRSFHTAVWTGTEMIVWGGSYGSAYFNTGGRYNPTANSWTPTSIAPLAGRYNHTAVWAGNEMIVWGGYSCLNTGARYDPGTDSWTAIDNTNAPSCGQTAVWTGTEMITWGSSFFGGVRGARYNPASDNWIVFSATNAPSDRDAYTAVWTGGEMIVWGGSDVITFQPLNTGARYSLVTNSWVGTSLTNAPIGRKSHTAIWTGSQMIVWGGYDGSSVSFNSGGRYCVQPQPPLPQSAVVRKPHGAGSFDIDLPLSGTPGIECRANSATNDHIIVVNFSGNVTVNGNPQAAVTSGIGTVGNDGQSNGGMVFVSGNVVTVPLTNVANAQTINVTLFSVNGASNIVIPMSALAGDVNGNGAVNASDVSLTKSRIGQAVSQANFRSDVNAGGAINATDISIVKSNIGTGLP